MSWIVTYSRNGGYGGIKRIDCKREARAKQIFELELARPHDEIMSIEPYEAYLQRTSILEPYRIKYVHGYDGYTEVSERVIRATSLEDSIRVFWLKRNDRYTKILEVKLELEN